MKQIFIIILAIITFPAFSQSGGRISNELSELIPEMPSVYTNAIKIDRTPIKIPIPNPPETIPAPEGAPEDGNTRHLFFLHGFGGNTDKWNRVMTASTDPDKNEQGFTAREVNPFAFDYPQNGDLSGASLKVGQKIVSENNSTQCDQTAQQKLRNFIIGHSQGGLVGKHLMWKDHCTEDPRARGEYGGLVTFASAHDGAQLITNKDAGMVDQAANYVCQIFAHNFLTGLGIVLKFTKIDTDGNIEGSETSLCDWVSEEGLQFGLKGLTNNIGTDYTVGSDAVLAMNACTAPGISKVAFYGVEPYAPVDGAIFDNPIFYRTIQHFNTDVNFFDYDPDDPSDDDITGYWAANDDTKTAIKASEKSEKALLDAMNFYNRAEIWGNLCPWVVAWLSCPLARKNRIRGNATMAVSRIYHDLNDIWMILIGASGSEEVTTTVTTGSGCNCTFKDETVEPPIITTEFIPANSADDCPPNTASSWCSFVQGSTTNITTTIYFNEKPSDGVVLAESAQNMNGSTFQAQQLVPIYPQPGDQQSGSSHMQMRNDINTRDALRALFDGVYGVYFETPPK